MKDYQYYKHYKYYHKMFQQPRLIIATIKIPQEIKNKIIQDVNNYHPEFNLNLYLTEKNFKPFDSISDFSFSK